MQHAGIQYGQGAANSHQSPPFADLSFQKQQNAGGNTTSSLRQFRKKEGLEKGAGAELNPESSHIARVPPHNHYPARPNEFYRYHPAQYPDYNQSFKEPIAQVKYSEIAETPPQPLQHVDHLPSAFQKHKEPHKDFMDMYNIAQQTHMKQNYPDNLARQQSYPPDASMHHQYLHKEPQVHPGCKPESQYQQYPQLAKYNMAAQCRKYPPPPENDFLTKLQRINPSMARSIMSDHHIRESQGAYPGQVYQNQRYYLQNNPAYGYHGYNYPSCNYKHPEYPRAGQVQYPAEGRVSPRGLHAGYPQKGYQYGPPEYAQHYQHRRGSAPQEYYQGACRANPYAAAHQISPEPSDSRASSGLRHFLENWAEEEAPQELGYKEGLRVHNDNSNEQVFVINSTDIPQCLENLSLVPTENGQFIIKSGSLDNSVVRIKETTENNGEKTVNVQIVEATPKPDCMLAESTSSTLAAVQEKIVEENLTVPYQENQTTKDCDLVETTKIDQPVVKVPEVPNVLEELEKKEESSVIVCNEVSVIKDMPLIEEDHEKKSTQSEETELAEEVEEEEPTQEEETNFEPNLAEEEEPKQELEMKLDNHVTSTTRRTQRIFSVDDIINTIGSTNPQPRRNSLQLTQMFDDDKEEERGEEVGVTADDQKPDDDPPQEEEIEEGVEYTSAISVEDDSVILEIGGAFVQLNINHFNGTKVLSVLPLSESLVIDVNGNYQNCEESVTEEVTEESVNEVLEEKPVEEEKEQKPVEEENEQKLVEEERELVEEEKEFLEKPQEEEKNEVVVEEDIGTSVYQSEIVIGEEESMDNEVFIDLNASIEGIVEEKVEEVKEIKKVEEVKEIKEMEVKKVEEIKKTEELKVKEVEEKKPKVVETSKRKERKVSIEEKKKSKENEEERKKSSSSKKLKVESEKKQSSKVKKVPPKLDGEDSKTIKSSKLYTEEDSKTAKKKVEEKPKEQPEKEEIPKKEKVEKTLNVSTKAAKKLYSTESPLKKPSKEKESKNKTEDKPKPKVAIKKSLEETVIKIKASKEEVPEKKIKRVTFSLENEVHEISQEENDKKRLSLEEYNSRKRKLSPDRTEKKIMEDTVTSSEDINDSVIEQVEQSIENAMKDSAMRRSPIRLADNSWEEDSPKMADQSEVKKTNWCIIDVNEFNIKPIESVSTPSPVSSSQFSYHSEDDSLQVYKDVVDSKLNSLNIKIPKVPKASLIDKEVSALLERFLNKSSLNGNELEKVRKIIEFKRKMEEGKQMTYEVRGERDYKDLKLHFKKVSEKRPKKRFRNLYTDETSSDDSDSDRSDKGVGDYSVYQRNSQQGVPKLIFKRNSGLPQPFVKLERSQAAELLVKKRKLY